MAAQQTKQEQARIRQMKKKQRMMTVPLYIHKLCSIKFS